jgi:hypothetical protein
MKSDASLEVCKSVWPEFNGFIASLLQCVPHFLGSAFFDVRAGMAMPSVLPSGDCVNLLLEYKCLVWCILGN